MTVNRIDKSMFREYDIRGLVSSTQLNPDSVSLITKGVATYLSANGINNILVGNDSRESSPLFHQIVIDELLKSGINVTDIGMCLVPMFYYGQYEFKCEGGIYISASHNPHNWNGFKIANGYSSTLLGQQIQDLYECILKGKFIIGSGTYNKIEILPSYTANILKKKPARKLKIVIDAGNATAGPIVPEIFEKAGFDVVRLYCNLDPKFPNHEPNPSAPENKLELAKVVVEQKADIGLAFDTDGDRLGVVDEKGQIIEADQILILLAKQILSENVGAKIVFDVKCTQALEEEIIKNGGIPIMWKTGHSYIKAKMREVGAMLGGEVSGHIFYKENNGFDDAVYAAYKLCCFLSSQHKTCSEIMAEIPKYVSTSTLNADCADDIKYEIVQKLTEDFKKNYQVIDINGARVKFDDGWGLVRPSSNLPVLVMRFEAKTEEGLNKIMDIFKKTMSRYPEIGKEWYHG